ADETPDVVGNVEELGPLLLVERDREAAEPVHRHAALLAHLERDATALRPLEALVLRSQPRELRVLPVVHGVSASTRGGKEPAAAGPLRSADVCGATPWPVGLARCLRAPRPISRSAPSASVARGPSIPSIWCGVPASTRDGPAPRRRCPSWCAVVSCRRWAGSRRPRRSSGPRSPTGSSPTTTQ